MVYVRDIVYVKVQRLKSIGVFIDQKVGRWVLRCRMESGEMYSIYCQLLCFDRYFISR